MTENTNLSGDVASSAAAQTSGGGKNRGLLIGGAAAAVVVAGGAAALAFSGVLGGGGGGQPEDVLPGDAVVFAKLDFDPGMTQKVSAFRLLDKVPQAKEALASKDPKKAFFEWAKSTDTDLKDIDYAADIEPWLGDRAGMALLARSGSAKEPIAVVALAVKDEAKAKEGIARLEAKGKSALDKAKANLPAPGKLPGELGSALPSASPSSGAGQETVKIYKDGYVLMTAKKDEATVKAALKKPALSKNATFTGDMSALGETGMASAWMDGSKVMQLNTGSSTPAVMEELAGLAGRSAYALRFSSDYLEVAQVTRGTKLQVNASPLKDISTLPADTGAFYAFSGGSEYIKQMWPYLLKIGKGTGEDISGQLAQVEQATGLKFPDDLQTLLGNQFDVVVAKQDFRNLSGMPKVGIRMWTDTAKAEGIVSKLQKLAQDAGGGLPLASKVTGEHLDLALDDTYRANLATPGQLTGASGFATVLPDLDKSVAAVYVDLDAYESQYLDQVPADKREAVKALQAVGMTASPMKDGQQTSLLRLSVN